MGEISMLGMRALKNADGPKETQWLRGKVLCIGIRSGAFNRVLLLLPRLAGHLASQKMV